MCEMGGIAPHGGREIESVSADRNASKLIERSGPSHDVGMILFDASVSKLPRRFEE